MAAEYFAQKINSDGSRTRYRTEAQYQAGRATARNSAARRRSRAFGGA